MRTIANEIPEEIERETEAIRSRFADPQTLTFSVAVTFLIPEKIAYGKMRGKKHGQIAHYWL